MTSYGFYFGFRSPPTGGQRGGRYAIASDADAIIQLGDTLTPIGSPVKITGTVSSMGMQELEIVTSAVAPVRGKNGLVLYEFIGALGDTGSDPIYNTYSESWSVYSRQRNVNEEVQLVSGPNVKVWLRNFDPYTFLNTREYRSFNMVADLVNLQPGDFLTAGPGNHSTGYWQKTTDPDLAWLTVNNVDLRRLQVDATVLF